jgi:putative spermidine/putrescine transport system ATP-binding protein
VAGGPTVVELANGATIAVPDHGHSNGSRVSVSIRPERLRIDGDGENRLQATVSDVVYQGDHLRLHLDAGGNALVARLERGAAERQAGAVVTVSFAAADCSVFPA